MGKKKKEAKKKRVFEVLVGKKESNLFKKEKLRGIISYKARFVV